jgi:Ubiquitin-protein ligase
MQVQWKRVIFFPLADPLVGSIATQYLQNREEHDRIARLWTKRYATWCVGVNHLSQVGRSSVCQTVTADLRRNWRLLVEACSHHLFQSQKTCIVYEVYVCVCSCRFNWAFSAIVSERMIVYVQYVHNFECIIRLQSWGNYVGVVPSSLIGVLSDLLYEKSLWFNYNGE